MVPVFIKNVGERSTAKNYCQEYLVIAGALQGSILGPTLGQQLELASELEYDLWDTVSWGMKCLVNSWKTQLVLSDWSNGSIDAKWMGLFLGKNHLLRCWGWFLF